MAIFLIRDKATKKTGLMDYSISRNEQKWEYRQEFNYSRDLLHVVSAV